MRERAPGKRTSRTEDPRSYQRKSITGALWRRIDQLLLCSPPGIPLAIAFSRLLHLQGITSRDDDDDYDDDDDDAVNNNPSCNHRLRLASSLYFHQLTDVLWDTVTPCSGERSRPRQWTDVSGRGDSLAVLHVTSPTKFYRAWTRGLCCIMHATGESRSTPTGGKFEIFGSS